MEKRNAWFFLVLALSHALVIAYEEDEGRSVSEEYFKLQRSSHVVKTDAGDMWVLRPHGDRVQDNPLRIGFINMEPRSLFIPQYLDAHLVMFLHRGEARVGSMHTDELVEKRLQVGDVYTIEAGSAFYIVNTHEQQRLNIICSIQTSENLGWRGFQSFFIGGGRNPTSILGGFDPRTMSTALNISVSELREIVTSQQSGPIVHLKSHSSSHWSQFLELEHKEKKKHLKRIVQFEEESDEDVKEEDQPTWSLRKLLVSVLGQEPRNNENEVFRSPPESCNLYDRSPDYKNGYGWTISLDEHDYHPLRRSGVSLFLVNIQPGSMLAPHINPTATEYGIVLKGSGRIEIVYPNGSLAMNSRVREGDVFRVPRYFPTCQIASNNGPFEFFGFTTSARRNHPNFLVGRDSILQNMSGPEISTALGVSEDSYKRFANSQREAVILPPRSESMEPEKEDMGRAEMIPKVINSFGNEMIMGFK